MKWPTATLDELCDVQIGRTPSRSNADFWGEGHPWLSIGDMNQGRVIRSTKEQITDSGAAGGRIVAPGTVLLSFKLSIGKVAIAGIPLFTNEAVAALPIRRSDLITPHFLAEALRTLDLAGKANQAAKGATLNKGKLRRVEVPLPGIDEQALIVKKLTAVADLRESHEGILRYLDELTASLREELFVVTG